MASVSTVSAADISESIEDADQDRKMGLCYDQDFEDSSGEEKKRQVVAGEEKVCAPHIKRRLGTYSKVTIETSSFTQ